MPGRTGSTRGCSARAEIARAAAQCRAVGPAAIWTASDARAEPWVAVPRLAGGGGQGRRDHRRGLRGAGARHRRRAGGRGGDREGAGRGRPRGAGRRGVVVASRPGARGELAAALGSRDGRGHGAAGGGLCRRRRRQSLRVPPADRWRLYAGPGRISTNSSSARTHSAHLAAFWPQIRKDIFGTRFLPAAPQALPRRLGHAAALGGGRGKPVRTHARPRSTPEPGRDRPLARPLRRRLPGSSGGLGSRRPGRG